MLYGDQECRELLDLLREETSWRFARPTRSFVLEKPGQPDLLDGRVYAFAWRGDDELIACAARPRKAVAAA